MYGYIKIVFLMFSFKLVSVRVTDQIEQNIYTSNPSIRAPFYRDNPSIPATLLYEHPSIGTTLLYQQPFYTIEEPFYAARNSYKMAEENFQEDAIKKSNSYIMSSFFCKKIHSRFFLYTLNDCHHFNYHHIHKTIL